VRQQYESFILHGYTKQKNVLSGKNIKYADIFHKQQHDIRLAISDCYCLSMQQFVRVVPVNVMQPMPDEQAVHPRRVLRVHLQQRILHLQEPPFPAEPQPMPGHLPPGHLHPLHQRNLHALPLSLPDLHERILLSVLHLILLPN
jgi:hypothetical protein